MTSIAIATEDELSEAVALKLVAVFADTHNVTHKLRKGGFGYLKSKMHNWRQMAERNLMLIITDLDQAVCPIALVQDWTSNQVSPQKLLLRVAVREIEAWVLADHEAMRELIGPKGVLPPQPDNLPDPKQALLRLSKAAPKAIREDLLRVREDAGLAQGLGYNARLIPWVELSWCPERAADRSPSLARTITRLKEAVRN